MDTRDPAEGQRVYTPWFLGIYDLLVLGLYSNLVWRCPTADLVERYTRCVGRTHLDVGPGTGYFLEHARLDQAVRIVLMDPNTHVLEYAAHRLSRLAPRVVQADVLQPLPIAAERFDSIALNFVLHCLPGPMVRRAPAIANLAALLEPQGVLFGATVLGTPELHTWLSRAALRENNRRGYFDNLSDSADEVRALLDRSFDSVDVHIVGSVAIFEAKQPRRSPR